MVMVARDSCPPVAEQLGRYEMLGDDRISRVPLAKAAAMRVATAAAASTEPAHLCVLA
jgi:hypothetical protein